MKNDSIKRRPKICGPQTLALCALLGLSGCEGLAAYNSHVAARSESISGFAKGDSYGGGYTHRVEYR